MKKVAVVEATGYTKVEPLGLVVTHSQVRYSQVVLVEKVGSRYET